MISLLAKFCRYRRFKFKGLRGLHTCLFWLASVWNTPLTNSAYTEVKDGVSSASVFTRFLLKFHSFCAADRHSYINGKSSNGVPVNKDIRNMSPVLPEILGDSIGSNNGKSTRKRSSQFASKIVPYPQDKLDCNRTRVSLITIRRLVSNCLHFRFMHSEH